MSVLLPLEGAQASLLELVSPLPRERVDVAGALGRYLAEPLRARRSQPAAHASAMDGYAVRSADPDGPWRVVGESAAGHPFPAPLAHGQAVRISTGALLPAGADTVVMQENIGRAGDEIALLQPGSLIAGRHVRRAESDFAHGEELLARGSRVGPAQIALALAGGHRHLAVHRPPQVAILDTGDELAADPECCPPHQVPASNGPMIAALLAPLPCTVRRLGPIGDDLEALVTALEQCADCDVIVTTGGASVGEHDLIRPALERIGARLAFWKVAIRPGKPLLVAEREGALVLGLPGNPVSAMVTAHLFLLPLVRRLLGAAHPLPVTLPFRLAEPFPAVGERREFVRARLTPAGVIPVASQDSGALAALAAAHILIDRAASSPAALPGDFAEGLLLGGYEVA